jgi:hypothetical protein
MSETIKTHSRPVSQKRSAYGSDLAARKDQEGQHGLITSSQSTMQSISNGMRVQCAWLILDFRLYTLCGNEGSIGTDGVDRSDYSPDLCLQRHRYVQL